MGPLLNLGFLELVRIPDVSVWYWTAPPTDFVSFGVMLIDFVPTESRVSLAEAPGFLKAPGGAPAIVAITVSCLGGRSAFIVKLGDDEFGSFGPSLKADGDREFMFYRNHSADMLLRPDELNLDLIRSVRKSPLSIPHDLQEIQMEVEIHSLVF
uniref:Carbohydrate kinase PfkB domain-containing protein n=1 Tax=Brassica oleracea var. oleracea TaxID=109376 RepID=A0A0D3B2Z0_BRAOL